MEFVNLENIVDIYLGITHTPEYVNEGIPFLSVKDISKGKIDFSNCKYISVEEFNSFPKGAKPQKGDILFCRVGTIGKPIIIPDDIPQFGSFVSLGFLRLKTKNWNPQFIKYWMESDLFWKQVKQNTKGASQVNLNTNWLKKFIIPEFSIETQNKIVEELNKITSIINLSQIKINKYDAIVKSQFIEMFGDVFYNDNGYKLVKIGDVVKYEQPTKYIVSSEDYNESFEIPVLTAGKSFILGYTDENDGIFYGSREKVVIFDDFTCDSKIVDFDFKVKSSAMKLLHMTKDINVDFFYHALKKNHYNVANHKRHWISVFEIMEMGLPSIEEQNKFSKFVQQIDKSKYFGGICYGIC